MHSITIMEEMDREIPLVTTQFPSAITDAWLLMQEGNFYEARKILHDYEQAAEDSSHNDHMAIALINVCDIMLDEHDKPETTLEKIKESKHVERIYADVERVIGSIATRLAETEFNADTLRALLNGTREKVQLVTNREQLERYQARGKALLGALRNKLPGSDKNDTD